MRRRGKVLYRLDWRRGYLSSMVRDYKQSKVLVNRLKFG